VTSEAQEFEMSRGLSDLHIGQRFESPTVTLEREQALEFARQYDPQPFHLDDQAAQQSVFKGLATSGWYTASMCFRLFHDSHLDLTGGIIGRHVESLQWPRPVRPGDTMRVVTTVVALERSEKNPRFGTVVLDHEAFNQDGDTVFRMRSHVLAQDPAP
jgi:acyl dehydratase